ncbi:hypothetical protein AALA13_16385 [Lachnospiraceae bacterium 50-23]
MKYTERHAGKAVIRDKEILPEAIEKLAKVEELEIAPGTICDKYCKYPCIAGSQEELDQFCFQCELQGLLRALVG